MIVGRMFEGDDHTPLQEQQHDAYWQALEIIVGEARRRLAEAEALVGPTSLGDEVRLDRFDHHVLQDAHDCLAALWRLEHGYLQPTLDMEGLHVEPLVTQWLEWLKRKMRTMDAIKMRDILMLGYMDPDPEHSAEKRLLSGLREELQAAARYRGSLAHNLAR